MRNLTRRVRKLESQRFDATGLVPHSEPWFAFWTKQLDQSMAGEDVDLSGFSIAVFDRTVAVADAADALERPS
jgi:hypothetical protein